MKAKTHQQKAINLAVELIKLRNEFYNTTPSLRITENNGDSINVVHGSYKTFNNIIELTDIVKAVNLRFFISTDSETGQQYAHIF